MARRTIYLPTHFISLVPSIILTYPCTMRKFPTFHFVFCFLVFVFVFVFFLNNGLIYVFRNKLLLSYVIYSLMNSLLFKTEIRFSDRHLVTVRRRFQVEKKPPCTILCSISNYELLTGYTV